MRDQVSNHTKQLA